MLPTGTICALVAMRPRFRSSELLDECHQSCRPLAIQHMTPNGFVFNFDRNHVWKLRNTKFLCAYKAKQTLLMIFIIKLLLQLLLLLLQELLWLLLLQLQLLFFLLQESLANAKVSARQPRYIGRNSLNRPPFINAQQNKLKSNLYIVEKYFQCATIPSLTMRVCGESCMILTAAVFDWSTSVSDGRVSK